MPRKTCKLLDYEEMQLIENWLIERKTQKFIAEQLSRSRACICNHINKNGGVANYSAHRANHRHLNVFATGKGFRMETKPVEIKRSLIQRIESLEMQIEILKDIIKEKL